jgi:hypothetical protein
MRSLLAEEAVAKYGDRKFLQTLFYQNTRYHILFSIPPHKRNSALVLRH